MTWGQALAAASARLSDAGVPDAARDAQVLLAAALDMDRGRLILIHRDPAEPDALARFEALVAARAARRPVSQILGRRAFFGHEFEVTADVLDPRPETELLVERALSEPFAHMIDLGTGSGAILLACLAGQDGAKGLGTDASSDALAVARRNADRLGLSCRAEFTQADWWQGVTNRFDLVVSNPPYIAADEIAGLAPEVRDWEPRMALTPGGDGLDAYRAIAAGLPRHLAPGGRVLLEIGATQGPAVSALLNARGLEDVAVHPDLDGRPRIVSARAKP